MFLLIPYPPYFLPVCFHPLHSTMFLLILLLFCLAVYYNIIFTFHNVSINTPSKTLQALIHCSLHSTMFLLIRRPQRSEPLFLSTLHSTMFLLIRNTVFRSGDAGTALHSTMFLLIHCRPRRFTFLLVHFTFHNVSINTVCKVFFTSKFFIFTFHNVSINTPPSIHPYNTDIILPLSVNLVTSWFLYLFLSFWTALILGIFLISQALSTSWSFYSIWRRQS